MTLTIVIAVDVAILLIMLYLIAKRIKDINEKQ